MATISANFTVPTNTNAGGRLQGAGFGATPPGLNRGDALQIVVTWGGSGPPQTLNGYFVISPVQASNQTAPSPFVNAAGNYVCFLQITAAKSQNGQQYTFASSVLTVPSTAPAGQYELTAVIDSNGVQWSEDPEFDTTGN